jgi:hypothetical protein
MLKILPYSLFFLVFCISCFVWSGEQDKGVFLVSPLAGVIRSDIHYESPGDRSLTSLRDKGPLYALNTLYTCPGFTVGMMGHYSTLDTSREKGLLLYGNYYFRRESLLQPMAGCYTEWIRVSTGLKGDRSFPLVSLDIDSSIRALHPVAGISFKLGTNRITPFLGLFNEQVATKVASDGMNINGQLRYGFNTEKEENLNYLTTGLKVEWTFSHFCRVDTKLYFRFREGEETRVTTRNRIDFFLSKKIGLSIKYDYFEDRFEKNSFVFAGPVFIF